jgi:xylan 1,4-beta-xylosidase
MPESAIGLPGRAPHPPEPGEGLRAALAVSPEELLFTPENCVSVNQYVMGRPVAAATPYDFPALAADYTKFPPANIENSEFDSLRSSGEAFAADLAAAGVEVELVTARGVPHGHINAVGSPMLEDAYRRFVARLLNGRACD